MPENHFFRIDYLKNGLCAHASGSTVTYILSGSSTFGVLSTTNTNTSFYFGTAGFAAVPIARHRHGAGLYLNRDHGYERRLGCGTFYDSGTDTVQMSGATAQADWNEGATPASVASSLASAINASAGGFVSASPSGSSVMTNGEGLKPVTYRLILP